MRRLAFNRWLDHEDLGETLAKTSVKQDEETGEDMFSPFERGPSVVGMRKFAGISSERPLVEQLGRDHLYYEAEKDDDEKTE